MSSPYIFFSIVVPVYGSQQYIRCCIESVLNQDCKDLELILVDDESPDDCPMICDEYASKDARVKVIHQKNQGISGACNTGIKQATGKYLIQLDNDDYIAENILEKIKNEIVKNEYPDILQCNFIHEKEMGDKFAPVVLPENSQSANYFSQSQFLLSYIENKMPYSFWSRAVSLEYLNRIHFSFNSKFDGAQDLGGTFECYMNTANVRFFDETLTYHRIISESYSVKPSLKIVSGILNLAHHYYKKYDHLNVDKEILKSFNNKIAHWYCVAVDLIPKLGKYDQKQAYELVKQTDSIYKYSALYYDHSQKVMHQYYKRFGPSLGYKVYLAVHQVITFLAKIKNKVIKRRLFKPKDN